MAGKYPGDVAGYPYPQDPPPVYQPYPQTTVVVQGTPKTTVIHQKPAKGLFGSLMKEVNDFGRQVGREIDNVGSKITQTVESHKQMMSLFQTGNVIQLISRITGKALQILMQPNGELVLDGNGPVEMRPFHTLWTVVNEGNNQVRLHNYSNYLTVVNGHTVLVQMTPGVMHGIETKWQLSIMQNCVLFESMKERGRHIGILPTGQLKPALVCGRELAAQFGVQLVSSPYPSTTGHTTTVHKS